MSSYNEKFSALHHEYHKGKMKRLSIGTEGFFDFFKKKKKEEPKQKEKTIEDFVNLFNEEFSVIEKKIQESEQTEWTVDSNYAGKAKSPQDLINSVKGHEVFLKELSGAMEMVLKGIDECNKLTKLWAKGADDSVVSNGIKDIAKYRVEPKHFRSLDKAAKTDNSVAMSDKMHSFTLVLKVIERPTSISYSNLPVMKGSFKFNKEASEKITLDKSQFISFMKELKAVNAQLSVIYKDYLNTDTDKFDSVIADSDRIYGDIVDEDREMDLDPDEAYGVAENYYQGDYTGLCREAVEEYVKYMHSFLKEQSKS